MATPQIRFTATLRSPALSIGLAAVLTATLSGCGGVATNREVYSVHQPVVEKASYTFDVGTAPGGGLPVPEQNRLADWFSTLNLGYGDRVSVDDPDSLPATRSAVATIAGRYGLLLADIAPVTSGTVAPGSARVVITRAVASVPGCPDWSTHSDSNPGNATSTNYGCAINGNLAAMVANKEDLVHGARGTGGTVVMSSSKAIETYRGKTPTGATELKEVSSKPTGGN
jgi:pilus assembly protein CpaD